MDTKAVVSQFYTGLYHWLLQESANEVLHEFPLLHEAADSSVLMLLDIMKRASQDQRISLFSVLVRKTYQEQHNDILEEVGVSLSQEDEAIWKDFKAQIYNVERYDWFENQKGYEEISLLSLLTSFKLAICERISSIPELEFEDKGYHIILKLNLNDWQVETRIEFDEPPSCILTYYHVIRNSIGWELTNRKLNLINYFNLYPKWDLITRKNIPQTVNLVINSCLTFVNALPNLLNDLPQPTLTLQTSRAIKIDSISRELKQQFYRRIYLWSLADAQREVEENYPFLSKIYNRETRDALAALQVMSYSDQLKVSKALVKYAHRKALNSGEILSSEEIDILSNTRYEIGTKAMVDFNSAQVLVPGREFKKLIKKRLKPIAGEIIARNGSQWKHQLNIGSWRIETHVFVEQELSYFHHISDRETGVFIIGSTHILGWLGIGETYWEIYENKDVEGAIETLVAVCQHFFSAMPQLLIDLDPSEAVQLLKFE